MGFSDALLIAIFTSICGLIVVIIARRTDKEKNVLTHEGNAITKQTNEGTREAAFIENLLSRVGGLETNQAVILDRQQALIKEADVWQVKWSEERDEKHEEQGKRQTEQLEHERAMSELILSHAQDMAAKNLEWVTERATLVAEVKELKRRTEELERHIKRLEDVAQHRNTAIAPPGTPPASGTVTGIVTTP